MGFCETIRRTGAVGSSLELMGGWYFGYNGSRSCCEGVSAMLLCRYFGYVGTMSEDNSVMLSRCFVML